MALNFMKKALDGPVVKPTGHEPLATHVDKLLSGAVNYRGLPIVPDSRPSLTGAAGAPKALLTMPVAHEPAFRSNIPIPFHDVVYNANALHVPDLETIGSEAAKRAAESRIQAAKDAYVPAGGPISLLHEGNINALQSRILEKRNQLVREGLLPDQIEAMMAEDYRQLRRAIIAYQETSSGISTRRAQVEQLLGAKKPAEQAELERKILTDRYTAALVDPVLNEVSDAAMSGVEPEALPQVIQARANVEAHVNAFPTAGSAMTDMDELETRHSSGLSVTAARDASMHLSRAHEFSRGRASGMFGKTGVAAPGSITASFGVHPIQGLRGTGSASVTNPGAPGYVGGAGAGAGAAMLPPMVNSPVGLSNVSTPAGSVFATVPQTAANTPHTPGSVAGGAAGARVPRTPAGSGSNAVKSLSDALLEAVNKAHSPASSVASSDAAAALAAMGIGGYDAEGVPVAVPAVPGSVAETASEYTGMEQAAAVVDASATNAPVGRGEFSGTGGAGAAAGGGATEAVLAGGAGAGAGAATSLRSYADGKVTVDLSSSKYDAAMFSTDLMGTRRRIFEAKGYDKAAARERYYNNYYNGVGTIRYNGARALAAAIPLTKTTDRSGVGPRR